MAAVHLLMSRHAAGRGFVSRASRALRRASLRFVIWRTAAYIAQCRRDGIADTETLRTWEADLLDMRVQLFLLRD